MSDNPNMTVVSLTVVTDDPQKITRAAEVFARTAAGLVLDDVDVALTFGVTPKDEEYGE